jgi:hypothetical protein
MVKLIYYVVQPPPLPEPLHATGTAFPTLLSA